MSNGQRKLVRSIQKKKNKTKSGTGCYYAPYEMRRTAARALNVYDSIIDQPHTNAVYKRAVRISVGRKLSNKEVARILKHITTHKHDHTRTWNGDPDTLTAGQVAWMLNGGDAAVEWLDSLG